MKSIKMEWLKAGSRAISCPKRGKARWLMSVSTQGEIDGPAPQEWDGPMVRQPRACCPQRNDLMAEMGWPVKEGGMAQGLE